MFNDLRYAFRSLGKSPGVLLTVVLCLGLGIGANTTIFSLTNAVFLRPLPVPEADRLVRLYTWNNGRYHSSSYPEYEALKAQTAVFQGVAAYHRSRVSIGQGEATTIEQAMLASANYFAVVGITPVLGRFYSPAEDRVADAEPVVVVAHSFWQARLGGDPDIVGRALHISGRPYTIVGVAPEGFLGLEGESAIVAWLPFMSFRHILGHGDAFLQQGWNGISMIGRLRPDVTLADARAAASVAAANIASTHGNEWRNLRFRVLRGGTVASGETSAEIRIVFVLLNFVVGLVLLIACANVANILLARGMSRRRELGIRLSLGCSRTRLIRQLLVESLLLGLAGGVAGLLLALWGSDLLTLLDIPAIIDPTPDVRVIVYAFLIALMTGIIFGLVPALQATRVSLADTLKQASRLGAPLRSRLRGALVGGQIALSVLLLVLAGFFLRSILELRTARTGVVETGMLAVELDLTTLGLSESQGRLLYDRMHERFSSLPGIESATLSTMVPSAGRHWLNSASLPDHEQFRQVEFSLTYNTIGPDYLRTLGTPLVRGRTLTRQDREGQPLVTLVNEAFANRFFPDTDPLGKHIRTNAGDNEHNVWEIVGVVRDIRYESPGDPAEPAMFVSYHQLYDRGLTLQIRVSGDPSAMVPLVRRELYQLHPGLAGTYQTFDQIRRGSQNDTRLVSTLLSIFGALALLLASVGLYGVTAYVVALRTHEIGVRMALGARPAGVLGLFTRQALRLVLIGSTIGLGLAVAAGRLLSAEFHGMRPLDPLVIGGVVLLMGTVSLVASLVPARRAAQVDPLSALRAE
jgi:predicted permease